MRAVRTSRPAQALHAFGLLKSKRHLLTGDQIGAQEAHRFGAISDPVDEPVQVLAQTMELAVKVAALRSVALKYSKRARNHMMQRAALDHFATPRAHFWIGSANRTWPGSNALTAT